MSVSFPSPLNIDDQSWWLREAIAYRKNDQICQPLNGEMTADVVIVGGGFTGLWTAIALIQRKPDLKIALIEAAICGAGASSKNGGIVSGYWGSFPSNAKRHGVNVALELANAGVKAQDALRAFAANSETDLWWREDGQAMVSASLAQDRTITQAVHGAAAFGVPDSAQLLNTQNMQAICGSPAFREGVYYPEGATIHPARLVRELRAQVIKAGVRIFENTPMIALNRGTPNQVVTPQGALVAREVVLATNVELIKLKEVSPYVTLFSSYAGMTQANEEAVHLLQWKGQHALSDARMFVHYFRKTPDHRVLMGAGSGPIAYGAQTQSPVLFKDQTTARRVLSAKNRLLPAMNAVPLQSIWGGPIDVSSDRLPYFSTLPDTRIHYAAGYSGHGVNPSYIGGQCLASLVLNHQDYWAQLPFCTRRRPQFPPEPFRFVGGRAIRWGILETENSEDLYQKPGLTARTLAALPHLFGLSIGTR